MRRRRGGGWRKRRDVGKNRSRKEREREREKEQNEKSGGKGKGRREKVGEEERDCEKSKVSIQRMHRACYLAVNGASVEEYVKQSGVSELPQSRDAL